MIPARWAPVIGPPRFLPVATPAAGPSRYPTSMPRSRALPLHIRGPRSYRFGGRAFVRSERCRSRPPVAHRRPRRYERGSCRYALGAIVVVGAVLRLRRLGATPLNFDESFTAMAGRLPLGSLFGFLRAHDSHPPLDYLLQLPLARAGAEPVRVPASGSSLCSIAALALFAWWMRDRGRVGIVATARDGDLCVPAASTRARPGCTGRWSSSASRVAVVADSWLRTPRRQPRGRSSARSRSSGLMTHVVDGPRWRSGCSRSPASVATPTAWRWRAGHRDRRAGMGAALGRSFLVQSRGGHSSWIPHTTPARFVDTISALVTYRAGVSVAGVRRDRRRHRRLPASRPHARDGPGCAASPYP